MAPPNTYDTTSNNYKPEAQAVADICKELTTPTVLELKRGTSDSCQVIVIPGEEGREIEVRGAKQYLDEYLEAPERRTGTARMLTLDSFIAHVSRYADQHTQIFCDNQNEKAPYLLAVLDYHEKDATGKPRFGVHRTRYEFPLSDEWKAWTEFDGREMNQAAFAAFLEERLADVMDPTQIGTKGKEFLAMNEFKAAGRPELLVMSRGLKVNVNRVVANEANLFSGENNIVFKESHSSENGNSVEVPRAFAIAIPVFKRGGSYQILARVRYRVHDHQIKYSYSLHKPDACFADAIDGAIDKVQNTTSLFVLFGRPEPSKQSKDAERE